MIIMITALLGIAVETALLIKYRYEIPVVGATAQNAPALQLAIAQEKASLAAKAAAEAETQKEVAIQAAKRLLAEQEEKTALARKAEIDAANAPQRLTGEAKKAAGEGAVALARSPYADQFAEQELRQRKAEADLKEEETRKAAAETARAKAEEYAARVRAEKDRVDCVKQGVFVGAMTNGVEGCDDIAPNGRPASRLERIIQKADEEGAKYGFQNTMSAEQAETMKLPDATCSAMFKDFIVRAKRNAEKSYIGGKHYSAFAMSKDGTNCGFGLFQDTMPEAYDGARKYCRPDSDCVIIQTQALDFGGISAPSDLGSRCSTSLKLFHTKSTGHGAFAAGGSSCGWSFTSVDNRAAAIAECQKNQGTNCKVIAER